MSTLSSVLATKYAGRDVIMYRNPYITFWHRVSGNYVAGMVERTCVAMLRRGIRAKQRIIILSDNMPESVYVSLAAYRVGIVVVPVFAATSLDKLLAAIRLTGARIIFAGGQEQYDLAVQAYGMCTDLKLVVTFDPETVLRRHDLTTKRFDEFVGTTADNVDVSAPGPCDVADIIFTSGTTGEPKGAVITHSMYAAAFEANEKIIRLDEGMKVLEYLPYSHVLERTWSFFSLCRGATLVINRQPSHLQRSLREIHPDAMCCVPHFWEKVRQVVENYRAEVSDAEREKFDRAMRVGREYNVDYVARRIPVPDTLRRDYEQCDKEVLSLLRQRIGLDNARIIPTAGAVVSKETEIFARSCGLPIAVGYGLTETTATVSCDNLARECTPGSVGRIIDGLELKFGENNEILVRGKTVMPEYYGNPRATAAAFSDGWFHTGDAGRMENGELFITGRIKQLMKTSNGKYIAPEAIESAMNAAPAIAQTVVVAEGRKFVAALIVPEKKARESAESEAALRSIIWESIQMVQEEFPPFCRIKRFMLLPEPLTTANGCLTSTMKLRRAEVEQKYSDIIETIYDNKKYRIYDNL